MSTIRRLPRPANAVDRPVVLNFDLRFEPLEERRLLAGVPGLLADINPSGSSDPAEFANAGGTVFFSSDNGTNGPELWKTDGTTVGTLMVKDIGPFAVGSSPTALTAVGGTLFFAADDGTNGVELWKSDGTMAGTTLVKNINPAGSSLPSQLTNVAGTLYFQADDGTNGAELWKSDGTELGTTMVMDIHSTGSSNPSSLTKVAGKLFFSADNGIDGPELWMSDPGAASTMMVKDVNSGSSGSYPGLLGSMADVGGVLFFAATDGSNGFELWKSDGTMVGTTLVKDVNSGAGSSFPFVMINVGGTLFFAADDGSNGFELWKSDGSMGGTTLVKDINTSAGADSTPDGLANVNGTLFFRADDGTNGVELWKSDGTFAGTELVLDINSSGDSSPRYLTNVNGTLYFRANEGTTVGLTGTELWTSDGTPGGTTLVADIAPNEDSSDPGNLAAISGTLFFSAQSATNNREPWILPATSATVVARQLFYNQSGFDGNDAAANAADDAAIATDKSAYLPGAGLATFANISSYDKGINGVMVDLSGNHGPITAADFTFKIGGNNTPSSWAAAPAPADFAVRAGAGDGGSDRVEITWADGAISNAWLEVTVEGNDATGGFNTNTGLASSDVFFFGNKVSDSGTATPATLFQTTTSDSVQVFGNLTGSAAIDNPYDYNRSGNVTTSDAGIAFANLGILARIDIPIGGPFAPEPAPASAADNPSISAVAPALTVPDSSRDEPTSTPDWRRPMRAEVEQDPVARTRTQLADESHRRARAILTLADEASGRSWLDDDLLDSLLADLARK